MTEEKTVDSILNVIRGETFTDVKLPPLPFPNVSSVYTAEFLLDYARQAVLDERERCAKVCDTLYYERIGPAFGEVRYGIGLCSHAIRKG